MPALDQNLSGSGELLPGDASRPGSGSGVSEETEGGTPAEAMDEPLDKTMNRPGHGAARGASRKWRATVPALILAVTAGLTLATMLLGARAVARLKERAMEENRLRLRSHLEHVHDYFIPLAQLRSGAAGLRLVWAASGSGQPSPS